MTLQDLGEKTGMHYTTVAKLERSQRGLKLAYLSAIATALGVAPRDLLGAEPEIMPMRMVPLINQEASASWDDAVQEPLGSVPSPAGGANAFALRPDAGAMDLVVGPDAYIVVDPDDRELRDDKIYAMKDREERTVFKRFRSSPLQLEPCSSDTNERPIPLGSEPITTIGRVVWQGSEL
jgi:repressor LexA